MRVMERGVRTLGEELGCRVPGASSREKCFPCNTGTEGVCRRTGLGYQIDCVACGQVNIDSKYAGETGRNMYMRGCNYVADVERR